MPSFNRRLFLQQGTLVLTAAAVSAPPVFSAETKPALRVGLITDLHYADKPPRINRHYRESLDKLAAAAQQFANDQVDFVVELGDLIDAADAVDVELGYLKTINDAFSRVSKERHYLLGNHCVETLTKDEFLGAVGQKSSFGSFDRGGFHFILLDACFRSDGQPYGRKNSQWTDANIPPEELEWLAADLKATDKPVIVLAHQRLDVSNNHGVKNNAEVRKLLEASPNVRLVLQGHSHRNDLNEINGIPYCTLVAMVEGSGPENNGYSVLELHTDGTLRLSGFCKQDSRAWKRPG